MAPSLSRGLRMQPIKPNELTGHVQRLREIFNLRFERKYGDTYQLDYDPHPGPLIDLRLKPNSCTIEVARDRGQLEPCAVLAEIDARRVLCSFFEAWRNGRKKGFQFENASMTFFLEFKTGETLTIKQMFRLEWDNWTLQEKPNKAAYPHWQFDPWLTASDTVRLDNLRSSFAEAEGEIAVFESAERRIREDDRHARSDRPDLGWFTQVHFPAIAPWATTPIESLDDAHHPQPHRCMPDSTTQLERWIDSALRYLKSELETYR